MGEKDLKQYGVPEFKTLVGATSFDMVLNTKTNKLFAAGSNGQNYKVEAAIDFTKPIVVLVPFDAATGELQLDESCFVNKRESNVKVTL